MSVIMGFFICLLVINGLVALVSDFEKFGRNRMKCDYFGARLVLFVKNRESDVEGMIRSLTKSADPKKLLVIDMGSTDETLRILKTLEKRSENIEVLEYPNRYQAFSCFEE